MVIVTFNVSFLTNQRYLYIINIGGNILISMMIRGLLHVVIYFCAYFMKEFKLCFIP